MYLYDAWFLVEIREVDTEQVNASISLESVQYEHVRWGFPTIYAEKATVVVNGHELEPYAVRAYFREHQGSGS